MRFFLNRLAVAASVAAIALVASAAAFGSGFASGGELVQPGDLATADHQEFVSAAAIEARASALFKDYPLPPLQYGVNTYRLRFTSRDFDGSMAPITALLYVPRVEASTEMPLLVFGSGTTGIGDACAPSLEQAEGRHFGDYKENMLAYAALGLIVILPDYLGFDDATRPQRYFSREAEGHVMLDAARAVTNFYKDASDLARPMGKVFVAGYSQGGHAAFSAADLWQEYAPEVPLAGAIGFGATTDVEALLREGPAYAPLIFYTYSVMYGYGEVDPNLYLQPHFAQTLEHDVTSMCIDQFQAYYSYDEAKVYARPFATSLYRHALWGSYASLLQRLSENRAGLDGHGVPALIVQGASDFIVTSATQRAFVDGLRFRGSVVSYADLPGVTHKEVRQAGFRMSVDWITLVARGDGPPTN
jgi:pimeloyl-ACP methyl ester carboxylesterase